MANFALIGGSGLDQLSLLEGKVIEKIDTPYGKEPVEICGKGFYRDFYTGGV